MKLSITLPRVIAVSESEDSQAPIESLFAKFGVEIKTEYLQLPFGDGIYFYVLCWSGEKPGKKEIERLVDACKN